MSTQAPTNAVTRIEPQQVALRDSGIQFNLDAFPEDRFNRLIPTQTIQMPGDLVVPVVQVVQLSTRPDDGDVYHSNDMKAGHSAPTKVGLRKLATAAAISIVDERRTDDGSDPDVCEITCYAEMQLPTGQRIRVPGTKRTDMRAMSWASPAQRSKFAGFIQEHTASRAENRAIRGILSLRGSYPDREIGRPFAVVTYAPNMNHPDVRSAMIAAMTGTVAGAFGPSDQPRAIAAGPAVQELPAVTDDDDDAAAAAFEAAAVSQDAREAVAAGRADATTGEVLDDEPDWAMDAAVAAAEPEVVAGLRAAVEAKSKQTGPPSQAQKASLGELFRGLSTAQLRPVFRAAFGREGHEVDGKWRFDDLQARDVLAVTAVADEMGLEAFQSAIAAVSSGQ